MAWSSLKRRWESTMKIRPRTSALGYCLKGGQLEHVFSVDDSLHPPQQPWFHYSIIWPPAGLIFLLSISYTANFSVFSLWILHKAPLLCEEKSHFLQQRITPHQPVLPSIVPLLLQRWWRSLAELDCIQLMSCQKFGSVPRLPGRLLLWGLSVAGEDGASRPFCSQRGAANLFTGDQQGAVGTGLPCKRPPRTTIQVGSWRAQRACL